MGNRDEGSIHGDVPAGIATTAGGTSRAPVDDQAPTDWSLLPVTHGNEDSMVAVIWRLLRQEPALMVSAGYVFLSVLGLWSSYFFYFKFRLSILDYLQVSDFLVAGLRDPAYVLILLLGALLAVLLGWPETLRRRNPAKVARLRARHWGWRMLFSESPWMNWEFSGLRPLTGMCMGVVCFMGIGAALYALDKAESIRDGNAGTRVHVMLNGDTATLPGTAKLLGSSSAFVFLWWPAQRRAEAVPIGSIRRLQSMVLPVKEAPVAKKAPAPPTPR
ncbi:hypothetical protein [Stenotrophomonas rhizophila]|uniref:hypothetical protein n=1 Tax=Stenotrophomonas rhizophila TaxID=216778 RepID=UPI0033966381